MEAKTLTPLSFEVYEYVRENGKSSLDEISEALGRTSRSVSANIRDLQTKEIAVRLKETVEGIEKPVTFVQLTEEGKEMDITLREPKA